jgi:hypothetical protein
MTDLPEKAAAKVRDLSPDLQAAIARLMLASVDDGTTDYRLTPEEAAELDESEAAGARGTYASAAGVRAIWANHGLRS